MHWIQTIRENLQLSRKELAHYLGLSVEMIISVELDRRWLPQDSLRPAITLYQAMKDLEVTGPLSAPTVAIDHHARRVKRFHRKCRRRLERCTGKLKEMQRVYANACFCLGVYQLMATLLAGEGYQQEYGETDPDRLQWIRWKILDTTQRIRDNHMAAQDLLTVEIAGLRSMVQALEGSPFFDGG